MKKDYTAISGQIIKINISEEALKNFGFTHGEEVNHKSMGPCTVIGVAPNLDGIIVLWVAVHGCGGGNVAWTNTTELEKIKT